MPTDPYRGFIPSDPDGFIPDSGPAYARVRPDPYGFIPEQDVQAEAERQGISPLRILATVSRYGIPLAGGLGAGFLTGNPAVGALAGAGLAATGETAAQLFERAAGDRPTGIDPLEIASAGAVGALPFGKLTQAARAARYAKGGVNKLASAGMGALEGASFGLAGEGLKRGIEEGRLPTIQEAAIGAGSGAALGGLFGAITERRTAPLPKEVYASPEALDAHLRAKLPANVALEPGDVEKFVGTAREAAFGGGPTDPVVAPARALIRHIVEGVKQFDNYRELLGATDAARSGFGPGYQALELAKRSGMLPAETIDRLAAFGTSPEMGVAFSGGFLSELTPLTRGATETAIDAGSKIQGVQKTGTGILGGLRKVADLQRAVAIQQASTAASNQLFSNPAKFTTDGIESVIAPFLEGGDLKKVGSRVGTGILAHTWDVLSGKAVKTSKQLEGQFPEVAEAISGVPLAGESKAKNFLVKLSKIANLGLGDIGERFFRRISINAAMRQNLQANGLNPDEVLGNLPQFAKDPRVKEAVHGSIISGLENTFAAPPGGDFAKLFNQMFSNNPFALAVIPYPRYVTNALKFITDYNPVGIFKLLAQKGDGERIASDPKQVAQVLNRIMVGTAALSGALAMRESPYAGDKWYEFKLPDGKVIDTQFLAPFANFLFLGEAIKQMSEHGNLGRLSSEDFIKGALSMNRVGGFGSFVFDLLQGQLGSENWRPKLEQAIGEYLSGFTVPFRTFKDFLTLADPAEGETKDVREHPIVGPTLRNIPFATRGFPTRFDPSTGQVKRGAGDAVDIGGYSVTPEALKQVTPFRVRQRDPVEGALIEQGVEPYEVGPKLRASIPEGRELQRRQERIQGELTHEHVRDLVLSPEYQSLDHNQKALKLFPLLERIRMLSSRRAEAEMRTIDPLFKEKILVKRNQGKAPKNPRDAAKLNRAQTLLGLEPRF